MSEERVVVTLKVSFLFRERSPPRSAKSSTQKKRKRKQVEDNQKDREVGLLCLKEEINLDRLKWIMGNSEWCIVREEQTKFDSYADKMISTGSRLVKYSPVAHGKGRVYADGAMSLQGFSKKIRNDLARGIYHDIDMTNCHPVFLLQVCASQGMNDLLSTENLRYYINHREAVLESICDYYVNCKRGDAKVLMLMLMYGGKAKSWLSRIGMPDARLHPFIEKYAKELGTIAKFIDEKYPDFPVTSPSNHLFSKMSLLMQDVENTVLMSMSKFFSANGYPPGVYLYDGLMIYRKERGTTEPLEPEILRTCEVHVLEETGFNVQLEEKEIGEGFGDEVDIPKEPKEKRSKKDE